MVFAFSVVDFLEQNPTTQTAHPKTPNPGKPQNAENPRNSRNPRDSRDSRNPGKSQIQSEEIAGTLRRSGPPCAGKSDRWGRRAALGAMGFRVLGVLGFQVLGFRVWGFRALGFLGFLGF